MPSTTSNLGDVPSWIALLFSAISLAWQTRTTFTARRDRNLFKKKTRIEQLTVDIDELTAQAIAYWVKPEEVAISEGMMIVVKNRDLSRRFTAYKSFLWDSAELDFAKLKQQVTGGNFQVKTRQAFTADSAFVKSFVATAGDLKVRLRERLDDLDEVC